MLTGHFNGERTLSFLTQVVFPSKSIIPPSKKQPDINGLSILVRYV